MTSEIKNIDAAMQCGLIVWPGLFPNRYTKKSFVVVRRSTPRVPLQAVSHMLHSRKPQGNALQRHQRHEKYDCSAPQGSRANSALSPASTGARVEHKQIRSRIISSGCNVGIADDEWHWRHGRHGHIVMADFGKVSMRQLDEVR